MSLNIDRTRQQTNTLDGNQPQIEEEFEDDFANYFSIEDVEDVEGIFTLICDELEELKLVNFRVEGFGNVPWPVDVRTDLCIVIEQVYDFLIFLNTSDLTTSNLDFYEQGIEKQLVFTKIEDDLVKINCHKLYEYLREPDIDWGQDIEEEPIKLASLKLMICSLIKSFVAIANELCPTLTSHRFFQEWCRDKYIADCLHT